MPTKIKIKCKNCGGDIGDVVNHIWGERSKVCRNCGHHIPMKSVTSKRQRKLQETINSLGCSQC